jgi:hypothetical protein
MQSITLHAGRKNTGSVVPFLEGLPRDKAWRVTVEEFKPQRSQSQNRYLRGYVYPQFLAGGGEALRGWTADDLHEYFLGEHFGWETVEAFGRKRMKPLRRSSRLTKQEFSDFIAFIQQKAAGLGIYIEDPDEVQR